MPIPIRCTVITGHETAVDQRLVQLIDHRQQIWRAYRAALKRLPNPVVLVIDSAAPRGQQLIEGLGLVGLGVLVTATEAEDVAGFLRDVMELSEFAAEIVQPYDRRLVRVVTVTVWGVALRVLEFGEYLEPGGEVVPG